MHRARGNRKRVHGNAEAVNVGMQDVHKGRNIQGSGQSKIGRKTQVNWEILELGNFEISVSRRDEILVEKNGIFAANIC